MAIVPYRVGGNACDQSADSRLFQIAGHSINVAQRAAESGSLQALCATSHEADGEVTDGDAERLENVGLVVWQSAFVLAEYLLKYPPFGQWADVRAVDLGTGTGVVGLALALAGADCVLTDLPHITPLTQQNVDANCSPTMHRAQVLDYAWGEDTGVLGNSPDIITGADVVYQQQHYPALVDTLCALAAPHALIFLAFRIRGRGEEAFEQLLCSRGFAVSHVPTARLHEEYQGGEYQVLRACRIDPRHTEPAVQERVSSLGDTG